MKKSALSARQNKNYYSPYAVSADFPYLIRVDHNIEIDNRSLVEECRKGDRVALNLFYTRFAPRMLRLIHRYVEEERNAEDILHDGFIVAFTRLGSLKNFDRVDYWLASIMKNLSLQFLHNQDVAIMLHEIPDVEDSSEIHDVLDLDVLESLIKKLPKGYQKVFRLAVLENKSHKEISKILGIAPNSSSSQLFHAKVMMRKLIAEYRLQAGALSLLLVAVSIGLQFLRNPEARLDNLSEEMRAVSPSIDSGSSESTSESTLKQSSTVASIPSVTAVRNNKLKSSARLALAAKADSIAVLPEKSISSGFVVADSLADSVESSTQIARQDSNDHNRKDNPQDSSFLTPDEIYYARVESYMASRSRKTGWSFGAGVNPGLVNFDIDMYGDSDIAQLQPPFNDPEPDDDPDHKPDEQLAGGVMPRTRAEYANQYQDYGTTSHHNYMPISFSLTARKALSKRIGVETGLTYTYLHTKFETLRSQSHCHWHYLGIPVKFDVSLFSAKRLRMYVSVGGAVDIPVYSNAVVESRFDAPDLKPGRFNSSIVWSLSASYGASFKISDRVEVFLEPTLQHHFEHGHVVPNIWTDDKCGFSLPIGFRLSW